MNILDYQDNIPSEVRDVLNKEPQNMEEFGEVLDKLEDLGYDYMRTPGQIEVFDVMPKNRLFYIKDVSRLIDDDVKFGEFFWWVSDYDEDTSIFRRASTNEEGIMNNDRFVACPRMVLECKLKEI